MSDKNDKSRTAGDNERMKGVIDQAKDQAAGDLSGHEQDGRKGGEQTRRAVDAMSTGNTPRTGDDPQHITGDTTRTPMPDETGGEGAKRRGRDK
ncbi:hypothetical protein M5E06_30620 [Azospirillum sp. A1-3]|uniref:hypothetical protein n=1 Tax=Azospirillum sp. A1-3 TaxID=185874 RepID=UPI00207758EE|nr:hypothetical protein [Azospirillum sp. A1-3]MCM8738483.1 hypothetical protein [Azospirillum sp. A1-3]